MAIEYKTVTYRTVESANDNATYCWVELSAAHVPAVNGLIKRIVIQGATTSATGMTTDPMYLGLWERQDDGGLISLGCSKNAIVQAINQQNVWDFDGAIVRGKSLLLGLLSSPTEHWTNNTQLLLRSRVRTNDTDGCVILTNIGRIRVTPDITFTVDVPEFVPDDEPEPEPDSDDTERVIDISKYWIPLIRDTAEFQQIAAAVNPELNRLLKCKNDVEKSCFLDTIYSLKKWEYIYNLTVTDDMTFEERKSQVLNRLNQNVPYTNRVLRRMIAAIVGDGNFRMSIDNDTQTFHMSLTAGAMSKTNDINQLLKRVLPMNLVIEYDDIPMDYTLLEYLESSGTQHIVLPEPFTTTEDFSFSLECQQTKDTPGYWQHVFGERKGSYDTGVAFSEPNKCVVAWRNTVTMNVTALEPVSVFCDVSNVIVNGVVHERDNSRNVGREIAYLRVFDKFGSRRFIGRISSVKVHNAGAAVYDLVPVLNAEGVPGMWDTVRKQCFYNAGTGTFGYRLKGADSDIMTLDLDDPYYVAPSGVWAKLIDENTLDIITALDPTVDESQGYKLFANVGDAYQYFNIKEVNEND